MITALKKVTLMDMHGTKEALSFSHKFVSDAISAIINLTFP